LGDVLGQCPLLIHILDEDTSNIASTGLSHDIIDSPPEALVLLMVDYGCSSSLSRAAAVMEVLLSPVLLTVTVLPKIVTLFQAKNLETLEDLLNQKQEAVRNTTPPGDSV
jgi:hypothetical protein